MLIAKVRQRVRPYAWNMGSTAYTTLVPRDTVGTHARDWAAFALRLRCVSSAPFGAPVVPLVYWITARSVAAGRGWSTGRGAAAEIRSQVIVPVTFAAIAARAARAFGTGRRRRRRVRRGMARVTSTDTMRSGRTSSGSAWIVATDLSHAITVRAPWSSNWCCSSRGV